MVVDLVRELVVDKVVQIFVWSFDVEVVLVVSYVRSIFVSGVNKGLFVQIVSVYGLDFGFVIGGVKYEVVFVFVFCFKC